MPITLGQPISDAWAGAVAGWASARGVGCRLEGADLGADVWEEGPAERGVQAIVFGEPIASPASQGLFFNIWGGQGQCTRK